MIFISLIPLVQNYIECIRYMLYYRPLCIQVSSGPLYDYVHRYDPVYTWSVHSQYENDGVMTYILNLTSLQWQTGKLNSRKELMLMGMHCSLCTVLY